MSAIYKRELKASFCNMSAVVFLAVALILTGVFATVVNLFYGDSGFENTVSGVAFIIVLVIPIMTMRSFAEEKSMKTDTLLYSLPIKMSEVVAAKFLALFTVFGIYALLSGLYPLIFSLYGKVNFASAYSAIAALLLLGGVVIAIGLFFSSLTENQVIAAVSTYGAILLMYLMSVITYIFPASSLASLLAFAILGALVGVLCGALTKSYAAGFLVGTVLTVATVVAYFINSSAFEGAFSSVMEKLSVFDRLDTFVGGIFDLGGVIYYVSAAVLFLLFTTQSMDKKRWM